MSDIRRGKHIVNVVVIVQRDSDLLEIVTTLSPPCRFTRLLDCRQQERNQNCNDCDDHQQFNQCESAILAAS